MRAEDGAGGAVSGDVEQARNGLLEEPAQQTVQKAPPPQLYALLIPADTAMLGPFREKRNRVLCQTRRDPASKRASPYAGLVGGWVEVSRRRAAEVLPFRSTDPAFSRCLVAIGSAPGVADVDKARGQRHSGPEAAGRAPINRLQPAGHLFRGQTSSRQRPGGYKQIQANALAWAQRTKVCAAHLARASTADPEHVHPVLVRRPHRHRRPARPGRALRQGQPEAAAPCRRPGGPPDRAQRRQRHVARPARVVAEDGHVSLDRPASRRGRNEQRRADGQRGPEPAGRGRVRQARHGAGGQPARRQPVAVSAVARLVRFARRAEQRRAAAPAVRSGDADNEHVAPERDRAAERWLRAGQEVASSMTAEGAVEAVPSSAGLLDVVGGEKARAGAGGARNHQCALPYRCGDSEAHG